MGKRQEEHAHVRVMAAQERRDGPPIPARRSPGQQRALRRLQLMLLIAIVSALSEPLPGVHYGTHWPDTLHVWPAAQP